MKKTVGAIIFCSLSGLVIYLALNPLRRGERSIEQRLAEIAPVGSSFETTAKKLTQRYGAIQRNEHSGFLRQDSADPKTIGVKSLRVHLGDYYHFPMGTTSVTAFWGFDQDDKLIEIWVWKTTDSL